MILKNPLILLLLTSLFVQASCGQTVSSIFGTKTPREQYEQKLDDTPEGRQWKAASEAALAQAVPVTLPYKLNGQFPASQPIALGLRFDVRRGERLQFSLNKKMPQNFTLYADLFSAETGSSESLLFSADTAAASFNYDVEKDGTYILRLQPELFQTGAYALSVAVAPSIGFPVAGSKAAIGSFWGDDRDAGKRRHEGVDIFAAKGTPAIASADGVVTGVHEGGIGGKVVWLRVAGKDFTLYYAHLDQQLVQPGQAVQKGDTLGLVGNTGNARFTPAHLHFGVYTGAGAVNPLPFISRTIKEAAAIADKPLPDFVRMAKKKDTLEKNTVLQPVALTKTGYIAALPNGQLLPLPFAAVQPLLKPIKSETLAAPVALLTAPAPGAAQQTVLPKGSSFSVWGYFNEYAFVRAGAWKGWVAQKQS